MEWFWKQSFQIHWSQRCFWWLLTFQRPRNKPTSRCFWSPSIRQAFHSVLDSLSNADKKRFLMFVTGIEVKTSGFQKFCEIFVHYENDDHPKKGLLLLRQLNWNKSIAPILGMETYWSFCWKLRCLPNRERNNSQRLGSENNLWLFDSFLELQDVELRCKCPSVPSPKMSIFDCTKKTQRLRIWVDYWRWFLNQNFSPHFKCVLPGAWKLVP